GNRLDLGNLGVAVAHDRALAELPVDGRDGGVDGLVTIEDVLEQIVGEIEDEHDEEETIAWREEAPGVYLVNARAELDEFEAVAKVDLLADDVDEEVDTLGGLVFKLLGRIPERAEVVPHPQGHEFEIVDADPRRIKRLRVRLRRDRPEMKAAAE
ncbi:MAG: transporter associated domain-containing protein, partial [Pseudomonadota bacterium]